MHLGRCLKHGTKRVADVIMTQPEVYHSGSWLKNCIFVACTQPVCKIVRKQYRRMLRIDNTCPYLPTTLADGTFRVSNACRRCCCTQRRNHNGCLGLFPSNTLSMFCVFTPLLTNMSQLTNMFHSLSDEGPPTIGRVSGWSASTCNSLCNLTSSRADWLNCISKKPSRIHTTRLARIYRLDLFQQKNSQAFAWILKGYVLIRCCPFFGIHSFLFYEWFYHVLPLIPPQPFSTHPLVSSTAHGTQDILQFCSAIFVADEAETFSVSVMRLGSLDGEVRCHFRTQDTLAHFSSRGMWRKRDGY